MYSWTWQRPQRWCEVTSIWKLWLSLTPALQRWRTRAPGGCDFLEVKGWWQVEPDLESRAPGSSSASSGHLLVTAPEEPLPLVPPRGTLTLSPCLSAAPASPRWPGSPEVHFPWGDHGWAWRILKTAHPPEPLPGPRLVCHPHRALAQRLSRQPGRPVPDPRKGSHSTGLGS